MVINNFIELGRCVLNEDFFTGWIDPPVRLWPVNFGCSYFEEVYVSLPKKNYDSILNLGTHIAPIVEPAEYSMTITQFNAEHNTHFWGFESVYIQILPLPVAPLVYEGVISTNGEHTIMKANDSAGMSSVTFNVNVQPSLGVRSISSNGRYNASSYNLDGFSAVQVDVQPSLTNLLITENGLYNASNYYADGFSEVNVSVFNKIKVRKIRVSNALNEDIDLENLTFNYYEGSSPQQIILGPGSMIIQIFDGLNGLDVFYITFYIARPGNTGKMEYITNGMYYKVLVNSNPMYSFYLLDNNGNNIMNCQLVDEGQGIFKGEIDLYKNVFDTPTLKT